MQITIIAMGVKIEPSWAQQLSGEFEKPYFQQLVELVKQEYAQFPCYPPGKLDIQCL